MKQILMTTSLLLTFACLGLGQVADRGNYDNKQQAVRSLVNSRHFRFVPQTMMPQRGPVRLLVPEYELHIAGDTLVSYLPYFGRTYTATIGSVDAPLDFKTNDFSYNASTTKKGGWNIVITPKNGGDTRQFSLSITKDGYASLQVMSNNRDPISFNGQIE